MLNLSSEINGSGGTAGRAIQQYSRVQEPEVLQAGAGDLQRLPKDYMTPTLQQIPEEMLRLSIEI